MFCQPCTKYNAFGGGIRPQVDRYYERFSFNQFHGCMRLHCMKQPYLKFSGRYGSLLSLGNTEFRPEANIALQ